jgi:predicted metal-dependent phosphoesterase TrpH
MLKIDFHTHTRRSVDAVHDPRLMVKQAKKAGLDALAITDHNRLFPKREAQHLTREFGILVIPGMEGGNIAVQKHWIALGIDRTNRTSGIEAILAGIREDGGLSAAPHPHARLGYADYAGLGFDAVESLNGSEPDSNRQMNNIHAVPEIAGSDAHAVPMLGFTWTEVDADATTESVLESVRKGRCCPGGSVIPFFDYIRFYPQFITHRILREPKAAFRAACRVATEIRKVKAHEWSPHRC